MEILENSSKFKVSTNLLELFVKIRKFLDFLKTTLFFRTLIRIILYFHRANAKIKTYACPCKEYFRNFRKKSKITNSPLIGNFTIRYHCEILRFVTNKKFRFFDKYYG